MIRCWNQYAKQYYLNRIQIFQNEIICSLMNASDVQNSGLHWDLQVPGVANEIKLFTGKHEKIRHYHTNSKGIEILDNVGLARRLEQIKPFKLARMHM